MNDTAGPLGDEVPGDIDHTEDDVDMTDGSDMEQEEIIDGEEADDPATDDLADAVIDAAPGRQEDFTPEAESEAPG